MPTSTSAGRRYYGWNPVATLAVTVTIGYGVVYAFGVLLVPLEAEFGWSRTQPSAQMTLAYLTAGLAAPVIGSVVDRHGARTVMSAGSALFAALLLGQSVVQGYAAYLAIGAGLGLAMACVLYEVAFTVVAVWFRRQRARVTLVITLVGALASTVFVPLASILEANPGWRSTLRVLAALLAATVPAHALLLRRRPADLGLGANGAEPGEVEALRPESHGARDWLWSRTFWLVASGFVLVKLNAGALSLHLVPLLTERGSSTVLAAAAGGAVGLTQLVGRVFFTPLTGRLPLAQLTAALFAVQGLAVLVLELWRSDAGVGSFVLLYGATNGAMTIARALLVGDLFGSACYGAVNGWIALLVSLSSAVVPVAAGAARTATASYSAVLLVLVLTAALAAALLWCAVPGRPPSRTEPALAAGPPGATAEEVLR